MAGISRSTTLLIAYLIRYKGMKSDDALHYVRARRSIIDPNPGFWNQLKQY
jgi:protein-tyrosine phosphatase